MIAFTYRFLPDATGDIEEIARWYFDQKPGLESRFIEDLKHALDQLISNPYKYQIRFRELRFKALSRFPYRIVFKIFEEDHTVVVFGIIHTSRSPQLIRKRLK